MDIFEKYLAICCLIFFFFSQMKAALSKSQKVSLVSKGERAGNWFTFHIFQCCLCCCCCCLATSSCLLTRVYIIDNRGRCLTSPSKHTQPEDENFDFFSSSRVWLVCALAHAPIQISEFRKLQSWVLSRLDSNSCYARHTHRPFSTRNEFNFSLPYQFRRKHDVDAVLLSRHLICTSIWNLVRAFSYELL